MTQTAQSIRSSDCPDSARPKAGGGARIAVFTGELGFGVRHGVVHLDHAMTDAHWLVLVQRPTRSVRVLLRNQWRNLKRNGWRWIPNQVAEVLTRLWPRRSFARVRGPGHELTAQAFETRENVRIVEVTALHSEPALSVVRDFKPDVGLSLAAPILKRALFALPRLGTVNLHKGKLPDFRGMPPAFWEMWTDQAEVGCSVHMVDDKLDTGAVLARAVVPRQPHSTVKGLQLTLDELGVELMSSAVCELLGGHARAEAQAVGAGHTYRKPTLEQQAQLRRRLALQEPGVPWVRKASRASIDAASTAAWWSVGRWLAAPRITVLLYHRVTDEVRDNLTVGVEQFDRQMGLLRQHCEVLGIDEVVSAGALDKAFSPAQRPMVAVTFDDGYLDNYTHAARILRRHGLPAAFFVSTGIIGTARRFPHDIRRGNPPIDVMHWEHLADMRDWGFTLGSHTESHIDCASADGGEVKAEMLASRDALERELGIVDTIFAYPFGGRQHMTPERLQWVKDAGYKACLSAYGGSNLGRVDRWNVLRAGISHAFSDASFLRVCRGQ